MSEHLDDGTYFMSEDFTLKELHELPHMKATYRFDEYSLRVERGLYTVQQHFDVVTIEDHEREPELLYAGPRLDDALSVFVERYFLKHDVAFTCTFEGELKFAERYSLEIVDKLARLFHALVREQCSAEELIEIDEENVKAREHTDYVHDIYDANESMGAAFLQVTGHESISASKCDSDLWNAAWEIAKRHGYSNDWKESNEPL